MLKTTSEELACPREDLSVARKDELRKLLLEQVPTVLGLLTGENNFKYFVQYKAVNDAYGIGITGHIAMDVKDWGTSKE